MNPDSRGFRGGRGGRVGARGRSSSFNKSFEQEQEEANIQVTFSNPKAASKYVLMPLSALCSD